MAQQSNKVTASVTWLSPEPDIKDPEIDLTPSDSQPPGVDDEAESEE